MKFISLMILGGISMGMPFVSYASQRPEHSAQATETQLSAQEEEEEAGFDDFFNVEDETMDAEFESARQHGGRNAHSSRLKKILLSWTLRAAVTVENWYDVLLAWWKK